MKILFLNPLIDAQHKVAKYLQQKGVELLFATTAEEAWKKLESSAKSVDLAVVHREGSKPKPAEPGLDFVKKLKGSSFKELPFILTTDKWSDKDCVKHQSTSEGAHAYLRAPFNEIQLKDVIEGVVGPLQAPGEHTGIALPPPGPKSSENLLSVETTTRMISRSELGSKPSSISLDISEFNSPEGGTAPVLHVEVPPVLPPTPPAAPAEIPASGALEISFGEPLSEPLDGAAQVLSSGHTDVPAQGPIEGGIELSLDDSGAGSDTIEFSKKGSTDIPEVPVAPEAADVGGVSGIAEISPVMPEGLPTGFEDLQQAEVEEAGYNSEGEQGYSSLPAEAQSLPSEGGVSPDSDRQVAEEMPYLFSNSPKHFRGEHPVNPALLFAEPLGDAVVPGGAAQSPDQETIKKYLLLREQDVAVLSSQLKAAHDQITLSEQFLREERAKCAELTHIANEQKQKIEEMEKEKETLVSDLQREISELQFQIKAKSDKSRLAEGQLREAHEEMEHLKERVRIDIRKIRVREKELENQLEIIRKDSEALLSARENKIIELKRKLDLLEFNMDLLQDQHSREKENSAKLRERLAKAAQVVRVAGGLLDSFKGPEDEGKAQLRSQGDANAAHSGENEVESAGEGKLKIS